MIFDNKITVDRAKKVLKPGLLILIAALIAMACWFAHYLISLPSPSEKLTVWIATSDVTFDGDTLDTVRQTAQANGITTCNFILRNPDDQYYDAAFSLSGYYSSDIFILPEEQVERYAPTALFLPLENTDGYKYTDKTIGLHFKDDIYVLINYRSTKDEAFLLDVAKFLADSQQEVE